MNLQKRACQNTMASLFSRSQTCVKPSVSPTVLCHPVACCVISLAWVFLDFCFVFLFEFLQGENLNPRGYTYTHKSIPDKPHSNIYPLSMNFNSAGKEKLGFESTCFFLILFSSDWDERGLHASVQRRLLPRAEGASSLRAQSTVSPLSQREICKALDEYH